MARQITIDFGDFEFEPVENSKAAADKTRVAKPNEELAKQIIKKRASGGRKSLKQPVNKDIVPPSDEELFKKVYYPIGEVAKMLCEQTSLIRYWANEFKILKPRTNKKGDRYFRPEDVKSLYLIYDLIRVRKFTIEGAKEFLKNQKAAAEKYEVTKSLEKLKLFLQQLRDNL